MDIITINERITKGILLLRKTREQLRKRAEEKAKAIADYEKSLAVTLIKLRNGEAFRIDGEIAVDPPVSIMEKLAKGICYKESIAKDLAETNYKNGIVALETIKAEINALQSILKYLEE